VELARGDVWSADLPEPQRSEPGHRRPLLVVQNDAFNRSRLRTTIAVILTSNVRLVDAPGNVLVPARASGLPRDSVAHVSQVVTVDRSALTKRAGRIPGTLLDQVAAGLRLALAL
jgi:mRNA interferase MazF